MSENVREVINRHHAFYDVLPYYVLFEQRLPGAAPVTRKIQAGFDVDVYGIKTSPGLRSSPDYTLVRAILQDLAETVLSHASDLCTIEVIPFSWTVFLDTRSHLQEEGMLRIRIGHARGLDQPAAAPEERALKEIQEQLGNLGVSPGRGGLGHNQ